jgi:LPXTG-site transpeptidase (sortase) family protein
VRAYVLVTAGAFGLAAAIVGAATIPHRMAAAPSWEKPVPSPAPVAITTAPPKRQPQGPPTRLRVSRIGVDASLVSLGLDKAGKLEAPKVYDKAGWFRGGPSPGDVGPAVLAGHVDSKAGPAVFYRLHELKVGDKIEVWRGKDTMTFTVTGVTKHPKDKFPTAAVYSPTPGPELRLVTCGGDFDRLRNSYRDNVVVFAVVQPTEVIPKSAAG